MRVRVALSSLLAIVLVAVSCVSTTCAVACELTASRPVGQAEQNRSMPGMSEMPGMSATATPSTGHFASNDCCGHTCVRHRVAATVRDRALDSISLLSAIVSTTHSLPVAPPLYRDCAIKPGLGLHTRPLSSSTILRV